MQAGLNAVNFHKVAPNGFGDGHNSYPHAMTWFDDHLYVTTTRDNLVFLKMRSPFEIPLEAWPVRLPSDLWDMDLAAQIWRQSPRTGEWQKVYTAPSVVGRGGEVVPLSVAFRTIGVFKGRSDSRPALYAPTFAPSQLDGSVMLRSEDGVHFEIVSQLGLGAPDWSFRSFRTLVPFKGRLYTAPTMGRERGRPNVAGAAVVLASEDPGRGDWALANEPRFGDPGNLSVFEMAVFDEHLYAGTFNARTGMQVWKTDGEGPLPLRWKRVLADGAGRGRLNEAVAAMVPFRGALYVGAAIQNGGYDRVHHVGPAAAELLRIHPDDTWDLVVGDPRSLPQGARVPISGLGAGFDNPFAGYFWQLCEHDGHLYLGTFDWLVFLQFASAANGPPWQKEALEPGRLDALLRQRGGFDLWRSPDGVKWSPVSRNGFGNRFNYGVRTMSSGPRGLYVGTTNPFGPDIAVRRSGGWEYDANPSGGLEIWLGNTEPTTDAPGEGPGALRFDSQSGSLAILDEVGPERDDATRDEEAARLVDDYYGDSGHYGFGYWREGVGDAHKACQTLVDELLSFPRPHGGTLLEVGVGGAAVIDYLRQRTPAATVVGVRFDACELQAARTELPDGDFRRGRWPRLPHPDCSIDTVLCIDVPHVRGHRLPALREMRRVLRPGGVLLIADAVVAEDESREAADGGAESAGYAKLLVEAGFADPRVLDRTFECFISFRRHSSNHFVLQMLSGATDPDLMRRAMDRLPAGPVDAYVLATARRPGVEARGPGADHRRGPSQGIDAEDEAR